MIKIARTNENGRRAKTRGKVEGRPERWRPRVDKRRSRAESHGKWGPIF